MVVLILVTFFLSVIFLMLGVRIEREQGSPLSRLRRHAEAAREITPEEAELRRPFLVRFLGPMAQRVLTTIARVSPQGMKDNIRKRLQSAGNPWHAHSEEVIFAKLILAGTGTAGSFWVSSNIMGTDARTAFLSACAGFAVGFLLIDLMISKRITARRKQVQRDLPYVLDLMCVCVEAGLAFDGAMQKVAEKVGGPLAHEFNQVSYEVRIGKPRRDALRDMRDRCGVEDLNTFIAAIIQAERLGLGIGQVLRVQSAQMRAMRRERAREAAMKVPVKMLFPLILLILPALFVVILGPAMIQMLKSLGSAGF